MTIIRVIYSFGKLSEMLKEVKSLFHFIAFIVVCRFIELRHKHEFVKWHHRLGS